MSFGDAFRPNRVLPSSVSLMLTVFWSALALAFWVASPFQSLPGPGEVLGSFRELWWTHGLGHELITTLKLISHATLVVVALSLPLSYLSVLGFARPLVEGLSKARYLGLTGLVVPFTLMSGGGYSLKVMLLVFGMFTFFVTAMARVVVEIPRERFDHMRVLGSSDGRMVWEVVIRGTLDQAIEVLRQNIAIGWTMITMVEGISRSDGGIGAMLLNQNKHFRLSEVYATLLVILVVGLLLDAVVATLGRILCPYAELERVRR